MGEHCCEHAGFGDALGVGLRPGEPVVEFAAVLVRARVQEVVLLPSAGRGHVLQVAWHIASGGEQGGAPVDGHALGAVDGGGVAGLAVAGREREGDVPPVAVGQCLAYGLAVAHGEHAEEPCRSRCAGRLAR